MARTQNEGEGSRSAARAYNEATKKFVKAGKVGPAAQRAKQSLDREGPALRKAEEAGKKRARGKKNEI